MYRIDSVLIGRMGIFPTLLLAFGLLLGPLCAQTASLTETGHGVIAEGADPWWKHAVFYEIYPRSFQDTNGDGTGSNLRPVD